VSIFDVCDLEDPELIETLAKITSPSGPLKKENGTLPEETIPTEKTSNAIAVEIVA
jgi:hypothetical protein|tara:strand:- start:22 stop:189 length:168 start_codon:yes stop_codon:yes gene_type:complete